MAARKTTNPIAAEALSIDVTIVFGGHEYSMPPTSEWTIDALEAFENGRILAMLKTVLDDENYSTFRQRHTKVADLNAFIMAMQKAQGIAGN